MKDYVCSNCDAEFDTNEEICPECGAELWTREEMEAWQSVEDDLD